MDKTHLWRITEESYRYCERKGIKITMTDLGRIVLSRMGDLGYSVRKTL